MAEHDSTDSARPVNPNPLLVPGGIYRREQVISLMGISKTTFRKWEKEGLKVYRPGTDGLVFADDVLNIIRKLG